MFGGVSEMIMKYLTSAFLLVLMSGCTTFVAEYSLISKDTASVVLNGSYKSQQNMNAKELIYGSNSRISARERFQQEGHSFDYVESAAEHENSYALIVGINEYKENTNVEYADYSALAFEELALNTLGVPKENIITLLNSEATSGQLKSKIQLVKELPDRGGKIYVFFAGHGVPGKDGNVYLLPSDMSVDSIHLESKLRLDNIYKTLVTSEASSVYVFLDSCFSGKDDSGKLLYKGVAPVLKVSTVKVPKQKLSVMTAGQSTDFANDFKEMKHRLFSYYLISELASGEKDLTKVYDSIRRKVKRQSLKKGIGYKQVPDLFGKADKKIL